jgi:flagellar hook protein FlgE
MDDAVSGLQAHQQWLDVIGNNIANVSTAGYKSQDLTFSQLFAQTVQGGGAPTATTGGVNPQQVGLGVGIGSETTNESQGALQTTGSPTDLALQGSGYFMLQNGNGGTAYTRVGAFGFDAQGNLVSNNNGDKVVGWMANAQGQLPVQNSANLQTITIPQTSTLPPQATTSAAFAGNLDPTTATGAPGVTVPLTVYDSLGNPITLNVNLQRTSANNWSWTASGPDGATGSGAIDFSSNGAFNAVTTTGTITVTPTDGAAAMSITPDFSACTQDAGTSTVTPLSQNGYASGTLQSLSVDPSGVVTGTYSNGHTLTLAQVGVATFSNPQGLLQVGQGLYQEGNNSGLAHVGVAGTGGAGTIVGGALEGSNVDLAQQFTEMIAAERGFQANAQVVQVANTLLQTLVQLGQ